MKYLKDLAHTPPSTRTRIELVLLSCALIGLGLFVTSTNRPYTSDDVAQQNAVSSLAGGSRPLIDLPQNTYVLKLPLYAALSVLPIDPQQELLITAVILNLLGFLLFCWAVKSFLQTNQTLQTLQLVPLIWLASLGGALTNFLINPNSRNIEIGLSFAALAILHRWYKQQKQIRQWRDAIKPLLFAAALGLLFYSDPYLIYLLGAPVVIFFGSKWLIFGRDQPAFVLSIITLIALVFTKIWFWLFWVAGIHAGQGNAIFATLPEVTRNIQLFIQGILNIFQANILGQPVWGLQTLALELNFVILVLTLLSPLLLVLPRVRNDIWNVFIVCQPIFLALIFIMSNMAVDAQSERYLVIMPFSAALIWAVMVVQYQTPRMRLVSSGVFILAALLNVLAVLHTYHGREVDPNAENQQIVAIAGSHDLTKGYATFWNAGINQYFANNNVLFIQSGCSPSSGLHVYRWLLNEQMLTHPVSKSFYLFDPRTTRCTLADFAKFLGEPKKIVLLPGQKQLLLYDYDISPKVK